MINQWNILTWLFFHKLTINNNNKPKKYINFFKSFKYIIPCYSCKTHYIRRFNFPTKIMQNNLKNGKIFEWTIDLHNEINKNNNKEIWSYEKAIKYYSEIKIINEDINNFIKIFIKISILHSKKNEVLFMFEYFLELLPDEIDIKHIYLKILKEDKNNFIDKFKIIFKNNYFY